MMEDFLIEDLNKKSEIVGHIYFAQGVFEEKASRASGKEKARYLALVELMASMAKIEGFSIECFRDV